MANRMLQVRKRADKSGPAPAEGEPWPLAGVDVLNAPAKTRLNTSFIERGITEGWISVENERYVHRPAGPAKRSWRQTHTFLHADAFVIHGMDGDVRYSVTRQPDKYADPGSDKTPVTGEVYGEGKTRVDWFYEVKKEG